MIEMIQSSGGRNSAEMVQSGVERDNDGAPSTPAGDVTPSSSVHSMLSELALIAFYVAIIVMHGANVKAAAISKEIEKAERRFDFKMTELLLAIQASVARVEALIADRPFLSNHELMLLNLANKLLLGPESVGLEAKLKAVSKMIEMIQLSGGRNSAGMVQSGVERHNDGAPSTPAGDRPRGREFHSRYREGKNGFRLLHLQYYRHFTHCRSTIYNPMGCFDVSLLKPTFHPHLFPYPFVLFKSSHVPVGRACAIFSTIYVYLKELISNFTLVVLVHSMLSEPALIAFYVAIIVMVGYYTLCNWGEHGVNVKVAAISKKIEKVERRFDLKMAESLLAIQASVARVEAHIAYRPFLSNNELILLNLADKLLAAPESVGLEAKLKAVSKMIEMIQLSEGRNSAGIVQSSV
ncbi:hypothetical protein ACLOJK_016284 [Asimina triloba]